MMSEYIKNIDIHEAYSLIKEQKVTLIDVREKEETDAGIIGGAQIAPLSNLIIAIDDCDIDKSKPVLFYCAKGGRSYKAAEFLNENILRDCECLNMAGGIVEWVESDYPVTSPS